MRSLSMFTYNHIKIIITIASVICSTLLLSSCGGLDKMSRGQVMKDGQMGDKPQTATMSDQEAAVALAKEQFPTSFGTLEGYKTVQCDGGLFWIVLFDPQESHSDGMGVEYLVSKQPRYVVASHRIPLAPLTSGGKGSPQAKEINRSGALAIAERDAAAKIGSLSRHELTVCELARSWRIRYSPKKGLSGGGPEYVIDKRTGDFLDKRYTQ